MRILLFLLTNLAVVIVVGTVWRLLGFDSFLAANGVGLDFNALLVFCALFGMGGSLFSLFISKWMAKRSTGTRVVETPSNRDEEWLVQTVRQLAENAGIGMPEVGIFPSDAPNALGVVNTFVMFFARVIGHTVDRVVFKNERGLGLGYWIGTIVAEILLSILASMIVMWFSRYREFRADAAGADLAGKANMTAALRRLQSEMNTPSDLPGELTAFGIRPGGSKFGQLFSSHPPLDKRIEALQNR
jgi:heat shock protein HtpX